MACAIGRQLDSAPAQAVLHVCGSFRCEGKEPPIPPLAFFWRSCCRCWYGTHPWLAPLAGSSTAPLTRLCFMCAARFTVKVKSLPSNPFLSSALLLPMLVWDASMACAIGRQLDSAPEQAVLHVCGSFHCEGKHTPPPHPQPHLSLLFGQHAQTRVRRLSRGKQGCARSQPTPSPSFLHSTLFRRQAWQSRDLTHHSLLEGPLPSPSPPSTPKASTASPR
jgi:hypothetical protein